AVPQEFECAAVQLIRTGLRHHVNNRARAPAVLRAVTVGLNAELFERIRIREWIVHIRVVVLIAAAIEVVINVVGAASIGSNGLAAGVRGGLLRIAAAAGIRGGKIGRSGSK